MQVMRLATYISDAVGGILKKIQNEFTKYGTRLVCATTSSKTMLLWRIVKRWLEHYFLLLV